MKKIKVTYTAEEYEEIQAWYREHQSELPQSLKLGAMQWNNLPNAVNYLLRVTQKQYKNSIFAGQIELLLLIKEAIENKE